MAIFGTDKEQNERIDAIEEWLQGLTAVVQKQNLALAELRLDVMKLKTQLGDKLSESDVDPAIVALSDKLSQARVLAKEAAGAAESGWKKMQQSALDALDELDRELAEASETRED